MSVSIRAYNSLNAAVNTRLQSSHLGKQNILLIEINVLTVTEDLLHR